MARGNNRVIKTLQLSRKWAHSNYHVDYHSLDGLDVDGSDEDDGD